MLNIVVCDDCINEQKQILTFLEEASKKQGINISVECFNSSSELLNSVKNKQYQVYFLDMYIDKLTGVDIAKIIRKNDRSCKIVFISCSTDKMIQCFPYDVCTYIMKPFNIGDVEKALQLVSKQDEENEILNVTSKSSQCRIEYKRINYFESKLKYVDVHFIGDIDCVSYIQTLDFLETILPEDFKRCHRSFIVNFSYVHKLNKSNHSFEMKDGTIIPISRTYYKKIGKEYLNYSLGVGYT